MTATAQAASPANGKRVVKTMRNLDDSLRLLNFITMKSFGAVLLFFSLTSALDAVNFWSALFGSYGFFIHKALTLVVAFALHWVEKHEDEHFVPSAITYYLSRPWRSIYSGARGEGGRSLEEVFDGQRA